MRRKHAPCLWYSHAEDICTFETQTGGVVPTRPQLLLISELFPLSLCSKTFYVGP